MLSYFKPTRWQCEVASAASGAATGLSAPGFELWWLAWLGLTPLFLCVDASSTLWQSARRGWLFGFAYNLVWLSWMLRLNPPLWVGVESKTHVTILAFAVWLSAGLVYGAVWASAALAVKLVMMSGSLAAVPSQGRISLPAVVALPAVLAFLIVWLGNQPDLLLLPLSSLEYSQYKVTPILQVCSVVGGAGLLFILVAHNVALAVLIACWRRSGRMLKSAGFRAALVQWLVVFLAVAGIALGGAYTVKSAVVPADREVCVLQSGLMIETDRLGRGLKPNEVLSIGLPLLGRCRPGLAVWTETSFSVLFDPQAAYYSSLKAVAKERDLDIIFGVEDKDPLTGKKYNAAVGLTSSGEFAGEIYRKRYLIPFGEFEPLVVRLIPQALRVKLPAVPPYRPASEATVITLDGGKAALLICGENADPSLSRKSVRAGGQVIANISSLYWFYNSSLGEQTIAMGAVRAVENRRYYIYAADTGPSFVVDPLGRLVACANWGEVRNLPGRFAYLSDLSWFCRLFP